MKKINVITTATALAMLTLAGCKTAPTKAVSSLDNPSLAGSWMASDTAKYKATVESVDPAQRKIVLASKKHGTIPCKIAGTGSLDSVRAGDKVKAKVIETKAIFQSKNGAPPTAAGIKVADIPELALPAGTVLQSTDTPAKISSVDTSYRLITVTYGDGQKTTFKTDLGAPLEDVHRGDDVVIRQIEGLVVGIKVL